MTTIATSPLLTVDDARVRFGGVQALAGVSLAVARGAVVGLIGSNGAGKTTLLHAISGLRRLDAGAIVLDGRRIDDLPAHRRAALGLGRSFQNLGLIPDATVRDNVLAAQYLACGYRAADVLLRPWRQGRGERLARTAADAALAGLGLADVADAEVRDLSFGVARRVELAGLISRGPKLLLLDEPTTGLDAAETETLAQTVLRLREERGQSAVVVAHDVEFVLRTCDHVYAMAEGRVIYDGPAAGVRDDAAVRTAFLGPEEAIAR